MAASKVDVLTRLFLAIEFVEHVVVVFATLLKVYAVIIWTSKHFVYFQAISAINR